MACMTEEPLKISVRYNDGQMIMKSERIKIVKESEGTFSLFLEKVTIQDSSSYLLVASNSIG
jgi:hypothetical protein